ncbi:LON peptidase N-terminal domain and RING finger protein 1 isoform X1 [Ahaetulla prasina]|uniref:LON peptidase N-terminal domain and RING finger protein 1 isoform X1 n=1 Tax=Ahaetulla prasina TaxID=499056 RepID=UPI00264A4337|nr:LON peptidase N-terminal domain and RING finger protein 1 isoform X1 [Ahaetulla prasina]
MASSPVAVCAETAGTPHDPAGGERERLGQIPAELFRCWGCFSFLGEPVTAPCGHTYCRRCLRERLHARCRHCGETLGGTTVAVVLAHLAEKWFPEECARARTWRRLAELLRQGRPREAREAADQALRKDPGDLMLRIYRAESYASLKEFKSALDELNAVTAKIPNWPEVYFRRATILNNAGSVEDALKVFLHCLSLDEGFVLAKVEAKKILRNLLSPENISETLKESALNTSYIRSKQLKHSSAFEMEDSYDCLQLTPVSVLEEPQITLDAVGGSLQRAQSANSLDSVEKDAKDDVLKRVFSEPLLSGQEKETAKGNASFSITCGIVPENLVDVADFECSLCLRLFLHPVTTPCGHTFCKKCLQRCLDHAPECPLCKENLKEFLARREYSTTQLLEELILKYLPTELSERKRINDEEIAEFSSLKRNVPIFVCTLAYPTVPCPLHVFEPRYRLMIRRSIETGTKQFGMCVHDPQNGFADYGCMLYVRNLDYLPDGRSVVDTIGLKRFRVIRRGMKDGYCTADIEDLEDIKVKDEGEMRKLQELHNIVYNQACSWFQSLRNKFHSQILQYFGPMPEKEEILQETADGPAWCWWLLAVLPVDPKYQLSVLSMRSLRERLIKIQAILTYFSRDQSK